MNHMQRYLAEEFAEEYHAGHISRQQALQVLASLTGSLLLASDFLAACAPQPSATATPAATATTAPTNTSAPASATAAPAATATVASSATAAASPTEAGSPTA